jgi:outer membrane protein OmpA-like peptidoglycan-associated protein
VQAAAPAPVAAAPHTLSVTATCDPCVVEINTVAAVTATVTDSTNCAVTYLWTAPSGTVTTPSARVTPWRAPGEAGTVPLTVTATCPTDNMKASATVNVRVTAPVASARVPTFENIYFDYDKAELGPDAPRALDDVVAAMRANAALTLTIEGHTCEIGTSEYNLALGERRALVVRNYLVNRGVDAARLRTASYGEERAAFDNDREETRRLNRRASIVATVAR